LPLCFYNCAIWGGEVRKLNWFKVRYEEVGGTDSNPSEGEEYQPNN